MKTVNFLTSHFLPENTACTNRVLAYIKVLEKEYKVNIIALSEKGILPKENKVQYSENTTIHYVYQKDFDGKNFVKRALNEIHYIKKLINISNNLQSDIVVATTPYMFMIPLVGFMIKRKKILDIRDLVWEYLDQNSVPKKIIKSTLKIIMTQGIKQFDSIIVTNEYEKNLLSTNYGLNEPTIISNGIDKERYSKLSNIQTKETSEFIVTYVGNIGLAQNIKVLIDSAKELQDVSFYIIGDGIELEELKTYAKNLNLKNIKFLGKLEWDELKSYYEKSSILYAQLDSKYISAMPSKLYEYASVGLPIIYGGVGQATTFVNKLENALVITPNSTESLIDAIDKLKNKKNIISEKNRKLIEKEYLREKSVNKIIDITKHLTGAKK
jgi:glycosyltransferase involved in cell wall biosynthesis